MLSSYYVFVLTTLFICTNAQFQSLCYLEVYAKGSPDWLGYVVPDDKGLLRMDKSRKGVTGYIWGGKRRQGNYIIIFPKDKDSPEEPIWTDSKHRLTTTDLNRPQEFNLWSLNWVESEKASHLDPMDIHHKLYASPNIDSQICFTTAGIPKSCHTCVEVYFKVTNPTTKA